MERLKSVYTAATASELPQSSSDEGEPTSGGIDHAEVRSEGGDLISFDIARSDGGTLVVLLPLARWMCRRLFLMLLLASRLAARGDHTRVDVAFATALPDRGGFGITAFAGRGDSNGSFLLEESFVLSQTLSR
jgi:hypothetical protein